jgi:RNA polymerase sigma-70 factor (ECF subfamily)
MSEQPTPGGGRLRPSIERLARLDDVMPGFYEELRRLAQAAMRRESPGQTLQATAVANEAYLRLCEQRELNFSNRAHFFATASTLIRRILVDAARARSAAKRGGGSDRTSLSGVDLAADERAVDLLDLDEALDALAQHDPELARQIELRYFGGLTIDEIAAELGCSTRKVDKDLAFARAWLHRRMSADEA